MADVDAQAAVPAPPKCSVCGRPFAPIRANQLVCGADCRRERIRRIDRARYPAERAVRVAKSVNKYATDPAYRDALNARKRQRRVEAARAERHRQALVAALVLVLLAGLDQRS